MQKHEVFGVGVDVLIVPSSLEDSHVLVGFGQLLSNPIVILQVVGDERPKIFEVLGKFNVSILNWSISDFFTIVMFVRSYQSSWVICLYRFCFFFSFLTLRCGNLSVW